MPSLLEAIDNKYGPEARQCELDLPIAIYVPRKGPRYCIPSLLVLNACGINAAGSADLLHDKCSCVEELDLAQNELHNWDEVLSILHQMPRLKFANLSFNKLSADLNKAAVNGVTFPSLQNLVLNSTQVTWNSIRQIIEMLPRLEELHLSLNNFSDVQIEDELLDSAPLQHNGITRIHLNGNPISQWSEVCKLGRVFPRLESLMLVDCPLSSLDPSSPCSTPEHNDSTATQQPYSRSESECEGSPGAVNSPHHWFRQLCLLNLNYSLLGSWDDIDRLARFPALHCLRITGCPLFEEYTEHERRQLLIARLPNIRTLNGGGVVGEEEREDAERAFVRHYMDKPESERPERYSDLVERHGKLDPLVSIDLTPQRYVKVSVKCGDWVEMRSIGVYQTVHELKQKLEPLTKIPMVKMRLFYIDQDMRSITGPEEMKFPNKQLYSYNINSGDEIMVDSKM